MSTFFKDLSKGFIAGWWSIINGILKTARENAVSWGLSMAAFSALMVLIVCGFVLVWVIADLLP